MLANWTLKETTQYAMVCMLALNQGTASLLPLLAGALGGAAYGSEALPLGNTLCVLGHVLWWGCVYVSPDICADFLDQSLATQR